MILGRLKRILSLKKNYFSPKKHSIVVWDDVAANDLENCIDFKKAYILKVRSHNIKEIYFTFFILIKSIFYFRGNLSSAYFCALLDEIKPKVVITLIDNSLKFFEVSRTLDNKYKFIAIQNAARYDLMRYKYLFEKKLIKKDFRKKFYLDNFLCFGEYEINHYKENNIRIKKAKAIGSLKLSNYFLHLNENNKNVPEKKFDIAVVSEGYLQMDKEYDVENLSKNWSKIISFSIQYARENNLSFNFIFKRERIPGNFNYESEIKFVRRYISKEDFDFIINNCTFKDKKAFSSYNSIMSCDILIGCASSMLREKLAAKGKILSCNFSGMDMFNFPINEICSLNNPSYNRFSERLSELRSLDDTKFIKKLNEKNQYLINSNTDANKEISKFVNNNL